MQWDSDLPKTVPEQARVEAEDIGSETTVGTSGTLTTTEALSTPTVLQEKYEEQLVLKLESIDPHSADFTSRSPASICTWEYFS